MSFLELTLSISMLVLSISIVITMIRFIMGPTLPDRVISLELIALTIIAIIALYSMITEESVFIDIAVIISLISFLGTIAFSYYLERRIRK